MNPAAVFKCVLLYARHKSSQDNLGREGKVNMFERLAQTARKEEGICICSRNKEVAVRWREGGGQF